MPLRRLARLAFSAVICALVLAGRCLPAGAAVESTLCHGCHTIHNSENGVEVYNNPFDPLDVGPVVHLLRSTCLGCHSNTKDGTLIDSYGAPIVYNTKSPGPDGGVGLAGGNFYWVAKDSPFVPPGADGADAILKARDTRGHNVFGISGHDSRCTSAPGGGPTSFRPSCTTKDEKSNSFSCHQTLAAQTKFETVDDNNLLGQTVGGCRGCHIATHHHSKKNAALQYRFLQGHHGDQSYVDGLGADDWEKTPTKDNHNEYTGTVVTYSDVSESGGFILGELKTISAFCCGCHGNLHQGAGDMADGFWERHPADVVLPADKKDFANYQGANGLLIYDPLVPVARPDLGKFLDTCPESDRVAPSAVRPGTDIVMCLSCHRAHGSPNPLMLRWPYPLKDDEVMLPNTACRVCHTDKP
ncbi:MAG: cytochrome c3 family protein [Pseudomonadota bacterium]